MYRVPQTLLIINKRRISFISIEAKYVKDVWYSKGQKMGNARFKVVLHSYYGWFFGVKVNHAEPP